MAGAQQNHSTATVSLYEYPSGVLNYFNSPVAATVVQQPSYPNEFANNPVDSWTDDVWDKKCIDQ